MYMYIHCIHKYYILIYCTYLPFEGGGWGVGGDGGNVDVGDVTSGRLPLVCFFRFASFTLCFVGGGGRAWGTIPLGVGLGTGATMGWGENSLKSGDKGTAASGCGGFGAGGWAGILANGSKVISRAAASWGTDSCSGGVGIAAKPPKPPKRSNSSWSGWLWLP